MPEDIAKKPVPAPTPNGEQQPEKDSEPANPNGPSGGAAPEEGQQQA